jgi:hypothetical protein
MSEFAYEESVPLASPYDNDPDNHVCTNARRPLWGFHGCSITYISKRDGRWWAMTDSEYASQIWYCPFCGTLL